MLGSGDSAALTSSDGSDHSVGSGQRAALVIAVLVGVVLRWWDLGGPMTSFDESFTAAYARLPLSEMFGELRIDDAHPPLDYLLRHVPAEHGVFWLRFPSAVFGTATLLLVAWWMYRRGWFGVGVVAFTALSIFQVLYAHEARLYSLSILLGTAIAIACDAWLRSASPRSRWLVGFLVLLLLFDQSTGPLMAGGTILVAGLRRDREAWRFRATVVGALVVWGAVWGPSFIHQATHPTFTWIPLTTPAAIADTINGFVSYDDRLAVVSTVLVLCGGVLLIRLDRILGRLWVALFLVPFVTACILGIWSHFLLPRSIAFAALGVPLSLGAIIEYIRQRGVLVAVVVASMLFAPVAHSSVTAASYEEESAPGRELLIASVRDGDAVAIYPSWLWPLAAWDLGADRDASPPEGLRDLDAFVFVVGEGGFSGRVWVLEPDTYSMDTRGLVSCGVQPPAPGGNYVVGCYELRV